MGIIDFYERVKRLAKANKMTIETTVGKAGLSLASYNAYRRHENLPRADEAQNIAFALGTTVEYLLTGKEPDASRKYREALEEIRDIANKSFPPKKGS
jgi:transcriptional regulator with XRE-family HTH domain